MGAFAKGQLVLKVLLLELLVLFVMLEDKAMHQLRLGRPLSYQG